MNPRYGIGGYGAGVRGDVLHLLRGMEREMQGGYASFALSGCRKLGPVLHNICSHTAAHTLLPCPFSQFYYFSKLWQ